MWGPWCSCLAATHYKAGRVTQNCVYVFGTHGKNEVDCSDRDENGRLVSLCVSVCVRACLSACQGLWMSVCLSTQVRAFRNVGAPQRMGCVKSSGFT
jgi:hypothetical protein